MAELDEEGESLATGAAEMPRDEAVDSPESDLDCCSGAAAEPVVGAFEFKAAVGALGGAGPKGGPPALLLLVPMVAEEAADGDVTSEEGLDGLGTAWEDREDRNVRGDTRGDWDCGPGDGGRGEGGRGDEGRGDTGR